MIDQDVTHQLRADSEEVRAVLPFKSFLTGEPQVSFVDQRCCLQRMAVAFLAHLAACDAAQFSVDERKQSVEGRVVTCTPSGE